MIQVKMKLNLTKQEIDLLKKRNIEYDFSIDYTEDGLLDLLDSVRDAEIFYAQETSRNGKQLYQEYSELGDKIYNIIPG